MVRMKEIIKKGNLILVVLFALLLFAIYSLLNKKIKAEIVYFYSQSCLGSFVNPEKAQGEPEVDNLDLINESNSAVYLGGFKEIYCGNFKGPIREGEIKNITLKFNMVLTNERRETPVIQPTSSEPLIEKILPPKEIEIINTSTENSTTSAPETNPTPTIETPQSFFYKIVFAEEATNTDATQNFENETQTDTTIPQTSTDTTQTNTETTLTNTDTLQTSTETTQTTSTEAQEITLTSSTAEIAKETIEPTFNYFDVFYTLDGINWNYLGSITNQNWQNINFSIPVNDWLTISKIQIKIQSNPSLENIPYLYLESTLLEVEYNQKEGLNKEKEINLKEFPEIEQFDFTKLEIKRIKGISPTEIVVFAYDKEANENQLLLVDVPNKIIKKIAFDIISPSEGSIIAVKDNFIFWLDENEKLIFAADYKNKKIYQKEMPEFDKAKGERALIKFKETNYETIYDGTNFYFKDPIYGEVFSDDYSLVLEEFRKNFDLDKFLPKEKLEELGFSVEEQ